MNNRYISSDQGSPNQAKWMTFSSWFQWNHFIPLIARSFFLALSAFWSQYFFSNNHTFSSIFIHVPEIWPIQGLIFNMLFQSCWLLLF